ncbi:MAG: hypothetical protein MR830_00655 [Succinatimonas sp.]|nr:hypothetical protein [Succinatimonas sp.]
MYLNDLELAIILLTGRLVGNDPRSSHPTQYLSDAAYNDLATILRASHKTPSDLFSLSVDDLHELLFLHFSLCHHL